MPTATEIVASYLGDAGSGPPRHWNGHELATEELIRYLDLEGFVIVPKEPTAAQINAAYGAMLADSAAHQHRNLTDEEKIERTRRVYRAMVAATPP